MTSYKPRVDTTIFPRVNHLKAFGPRADQRDFNGRIYGKWGKISIDSRYFPPADGAEIFDVEFPHDLGPSVLTATTTIYDLREDGNDPSTIDLGA